MRLALGLTISLFQILNEVVHIVKLHHLKNSRVQFLLFKKKKKKQLKIWRQKNTFIVNSEYLNVILHCSSC